MPEPRTKIDLHYRPVKQHLRRTEGCCGTCREKHWIGINDTEGRFRRVEERCAPIVVDGKRGSRKYRIRDDHVCDKYKR